MIYDDVQLKCHQIIANVKYLFHHGSTNQMARDRSFIIIIIIISVQKRISYSYFRCTFSPWHERILFCFSDINFAYAVKEIEKKTIELWIMFKLLGFISVHLFSHFEAYFRHQMEIHQSYVNSARTFKRSSMKRKRINFIEFSLFSSFVFQEKKAISDIWWNSFPVRSFFEIIVFLVERFVYFG